MTSDGKRAGATWWADRGAILCVAMVTGLCSMVLPSPAWAATIVVNSLEDSVVSGDGACTLREAVLNAERDTRSDSTDCAAGSGADTITFSLSGTITITVPSGLTITSGGGLTIDGGGKITITGGGGFDPDTEERRGAINVAPSGVLALKNLTMANNGGSISNAGTMTISLSTVRNNLIEPADWAGILNIGTMTISQSTISDNDLWTLFRAGSGIHNTGTLTLSHSTVSNNGLFSTRNEGVDGGAIYNGGTMTISNSTVTANTGHRNVDIASGIYNEGTLTLSHSTVSNNDDPPSGYPGIFTPNGSLKMSTSLIADDCVGPIISLGYNLDKTGTCGLTGPGDRSNLDPRLDPAGLKDNGGPTKTIALCTGSSAPTGCTGKSPAIDAVPLAQCTGAGGQPLGLDQRSFFRPTDGDRNGTTLCDIGAFEATSSPLTTLNSLVTFTPLPATYRTSRDTTGCPAGSAGKFHFTADLANKPGSPPVKHLVAEVASLTKGNLVLNADGGLGGDGATITFGPNGQYTDGVLTAKEHVTLPLILCLKTFTPFTFFVDVLGTH